MKIETLRLTNEEGHEGYAVRIDNTPEFVYYTDPNQPEHPELDSDEHAHVTLLDTLIAKAFQKGATDRDPNNVEVIKHNTTDTDYFKEWANWD